MEWINKIHFIGYTIQLNIVKKKKTPHIWWKFLCINWGMPIRWVLGLETHHVSLLYLTEGDRKTTNGE